MANNSIDYRNAKTGEGVRAVNNLLGEDLFIEDTVEIDGEERIVERKPKVYITFVPATTEVRGLNQQFYRLHTWAYQKLLSHAFGTYEVTKRDDRGRAIRSKERQLISETLAGDGKLKPGMVFYAEGRTINGRRTLIAFVCSRKSVADDHDLDAISEGLASFHEWATLQPDPEKLVIALAKPLSTNVSWDEVGPLYAQYLDTLLPARVIVTLAEGDTNYHHDSIKQVEVAPKPVAPKPDIASGFIGSDGKAQVLSTSTAGTRRNASQATPAPAADLDNDPFLPDYSDEEEAPAQEEVIDTKAQVRSDRWTRLEQQFNDKAMDEVEALDDL